MIVAPFDGVVAEKLALAFTDIAAGAPVFQVDGVRSGTEIIANASTTQAPHIDVGQRAELSWSGAEQPIRAVVRRVGLRAENGSLLPVVLVPEDNAQARALRPYSRTGRARRTCGNLQDLSARDCIHTLCLAGARHEAGRGFRLRLHP